MTFIGKRHALNAFFIWQFSNSYSFIPSSIISDIFPTPLLAVQSHLLPHRFRYISLFRKQFVPRAQGSCPLLPAHVSPGQRATRGEKIVSLLHFGPKEGHVKRARSRMEDGMGCLSRKGHRRRFEKSSDESDRS